jgi:hypothetical protein
MPESRTAPLPPDDTAPDADAVLIECLRKLTPWECFRQGRAMSRLAKQSAIDVIRHRMPEASDEEIRLQYLELAYGSAIAADVRRWLQERRS